MEILIAQEKDIDGIMNLHKKYHISSINESSVKDGFLTTLLTKKTNALTYN